MKKISLILFMFLSIFLTSCETNDSSNIDDSNLIEKQILPFDPNNQYIVDSTPNPLNLEVDSEDELMLVINPLMEKMESYIYNYTGEEKYFSESYPIVKSELDFTIGKRIFDPYLNMTVFRAFGYLKIIKENILPLDDFKEDVWQETTSIQPDNTQVTDSMFKIFANDDEVYYSYYEKDNYDRIVGMEVWISNANDTLEVSFEKNYFYYHTRIWNYTVQSYYKENDISYEWVITNSEEEFVGLHYRENNYQKDSFIELDIEQREDGTESNYVRYYNPETHLYFVKVYDENDEEDYTYLAKYNASHQTIFTLERRYEDLFNFEFNLMSMDGWDVIDKVGYTHTLYYNDEEIKLPSGINIEVSELYGINLYGSMGRNDTVEKFSLENSGLTPPIAYEDLTDLEDQIRAESITMINDFHTDEFENIEDRFNLINKQLDINVFYKMAQDYVKE